MGALGTAHIPLYPPPVNTVSHRVFMTALDFFHQQQAGIMFSWHPGTHVVMGMQIPGQTHHMFS